MWERKALYQKAFESKGDKPLLVVGTPHGMYGCGDVVLDLDNNGECQNTVVGSVENIPFPDKHFGAVFASHVLEHVCDPHKALSELHRVSDNVFVAWPRPWRIIAWANPGHAWLMTGPDSFKPLRKSCNAVGFLGEK
jgi:SAM-dependent methyltransferase